jgi:DNA polymerase
MVIGEAPGLDEDRTGRPFVGRAGQYLDRWLQAINLDRQSNCFIANIVKCRPPGNRDPLPEESADCLPYLKRQIEILQPKAILAVGRISTQILCERTEGIGKLRGMDLEFLGIPLVATYHPSAVLRNSDLRAAVWQDLKRLRALPVLSDSLDLPETAGLREV